MPAFIAGAAAAAVFALAVAVQPVDARFIPDLSKIVPVHEHGVNSSFPVMVKSSMHQPNIKTTTDTDTTNPVKQTIGPNGQLLIPFSSSMQTPVLPIEIGTPPQTLNLMLDTGSSVTWMRSSLCFNGNDCLWDQPMYNYTGTIQLNTRLVQSDQKIDVSYVDGASVVCLKVTDTITIANTTLSDMPICSTVYSHSPSPRKIDGIVGLHAYGVDEPVGIVGRLLENYGNGHHVMSFWFDQGVNTIGRSTGVFDELEFPVENAGELSLGAPNPSRYTGNIKWMTLMEDMPAWSVPFNGIHIGDQVYSLSMRYPLADGSGFKRGPGFAVVDTGASLIMLQSDLAEKTRVAMNGELKGGVYEVDCKRVKTFKPITFILDNKQYTLKWTDQIIVINNEACMSVFAPTPGASQINILGSSFMRTVYTSFDMRGKRVGFSKLAVAGVAPVLPVLPAPKVVPRPVPPPPHDTNKKKDDWKKSSAQSVVIVSNAVLAASVAGITAATLLF